MDTSKNAFQLLGQGTYGCVYRPAFHKKTMKPLSANKVSKAKEDFPEPETPVMTMSFLSGMDTSIFLRLCILAPDIVMYF